MTESVLLVQQILAGDSAAETRLVERFGRGVLAVARRATRDRDAAEDVYQETFRVAIEKIRLGELRDPEKLAGFLSSLARNLAVQHYRREGKYESGLEMDDEAPAALPEDSPLAKLLLRERAALVREVLGEMETERDRQILFRFYVADEDKERICEDLGLTSLHFNRVLFRARERYRQLFEKRAKEKGGIIALLLALLLLT